jgi:putative protease
MKWITYGTNLRDLSLIKELGGDEVILGHRDFSRFGVLDDEGFERIIARAKELNLKIIFEWDIIMTENIFQKCLQLIPKFLPQIDVLRVQDPGALQWSLENTSLPLQFIAENGNHNLEGLRTWSNYIGMRLDRIVLSIELTRENLKAYLRELNVPCEILGLGRVLLFYTPRHLLSPLASDKIEMNSMLSAVGESEESPHKGFPLIENKHGTFMFHIKDFSLMEFASELREFGLDTFRLDFRWTEINLLKPSVELIKNFQEENFKNFKEHYPNDLTKGFYQVNKTDVLFPKLKNSRLQRRDGNFLGEVLEVEKGEYLAIMIKNSRGLYKTDEIKIVHPKGKEFFVKIFSLKNINHTDIEHAAENSLCLIQFVGGVWVKSQVYLDESL